MKKKTIHVLGRSLVLDIRLDRRTRGYKLTMQPEGRLKLTLPRNLSEKDMQSLLDRHRRWIGSRLKEQEIKARIGDPFTCKNGAHLPVLGNSVRLSLQPAEDQPPGWRFKNGHLEICVPESKPAYILPVIQQWYRRITYSFLEKRVPFWAEQVHVTFTRIYVKNQRSLWASCSRKKNLNFNWRTVLLPYSTADYLIIHELCHLKELNHSPKFWAIVENHCPDFKKENDYLKKVNHWLKFP
jgi:hypothetical protein